MWFSIVKLIWNQQAHIKQTNKWSKHFINNFRANALVFYPTTLNWCE